MRLFFIILICFPIFGLNISPAMAQYKPVDFKITAPFDYKPPKTEVKWIVFETPNFSIGVTDKEQGIYLQRNLEKMKTWAYTRWGLPDMDFSKKCKVFCVPNKKLMKTLFGLNGSYGEVTKDASSLWLIWEPEMSPAQTIPSALTLVCAAEFERASGIKMDYWFVRGMAYLNATIPQIRHNFLKLKTHLDKDDKIYFSKAIFTMDEERCRKQKNMLLFDLEAAALCLMLRKEFGQKNLALFVSGNPSEQAMRAVYGFDGYRDFDSTFKRYMLNLCEDVSGDITPNDYLDIQPIRR